MITKFPALKSMNNPYAYSVLALISMFYMSIMLCNAVLTNRYIGTDALFVLGGTFTSPLVFILDDIITEIYGYKIARSVIITLERFAFRQANTSDPDERTKLNIRDSDGTLIIVPTLPLPDTIRDGTLLTIEEAKRTGKPHLIIALNEREAAVDTIRSWVDENNIHTLNIGGPRESNSPSVYEDTCELLRALLTPTLQCSV
ncbi:MAG: putative molybdenum carrier protein [Legionellaceae bacterium]|nr:putative molybdenum carrier protein [Legionellaceae bacterium]